MRIAFERVEKKFEVPVHIAIERSHGCRTTQLSPSLTWGHIFGCSWPGSGFGGLSRCRIESMNTVETTKLAQSARMALAAPIAAIRAPAIGGPLIWETLAVNCSFELPSIRCSRSINAGRYDWYATSKKTVKIPITNSRTSRCQTCRSWSAQRMGINASSTARVADDQDVAAPQPVDPHAGRQREEDERQEPHHAEQRELERARVQVESGEQWDRQSGDHRAELADRLARPELDEVAVRPKAAGRPTHLPRQGRRAR